MSTIWCFLLLVGSPRSCFFPPFSHYEDCEDAHLSTCFSWLSYSCLTSQEHLHLFGQCVNLAKEGFCFAAQADLPSPTLRV